eukprot:gene58058-biopygen55841
MHRTVAPLLPADPPMRDPFIGVIDDDALRNIAETRECALCAERGEKLRRCMQCRSVWYCSAACQKGHWSAHWPASGLPYLAEK